MATEVSSGLYRFFTEAELDLEKAKYIAAVKQSTAVKEASGGAGVLAGGTINGQTVNFAFPVGVGSLEEWGAIIYDAYAQLADTPTIFTDRARARFDAPNLYRIWPTS